MDYYIIDIGDNIPTRFTLEERMGAHGGALWCSRGGYDANAAYAAGCTVSPGLGADAELRAPMLFR